MTEYSLQSKDVGHLFLNRLIVRAYQGVVEDMLLMLQIDPGKLPPPELLAAHQWFQTLDEQGQENIRVIVRESVEAAVFGCLAVLDGVTGGYPLKDQLSDFALYLQTYEDEQALKSNSPQVKVRFNEGKDEALHDIFQGMIRERDL
jgi:hypothetical protein